MSGCQPALPFPFTLTGRTENLLRGRLDLGELDLGDTIKRLKAYEAAGAFGRLGATAAVARLRFLVSRSWLAAYPKEVEDTAREVAAAGSRVDELRAGTMEETTVAASASRLQAFIGRIAPPDQLADPARTAIAERLRQLRT